MRINHGINDKSINVHIYVCILCKKKEKEIKQNLHKNEKIVNVYAKKIK